MPIVFRNAENTSLEDDGTRCHADMGDRIGTLAVFGKVELMTRDMLQVCNDESIALFPP